MPERNMKATCGTCPYFDSLPQTTEGGFCVAGGYCRKDPNAKAKLPDSWCGHHPDFYLPEVETDETTFGQLCEVGRRYCKEEGIDEICITLRGVSLPPRRMTPERQALVDAAVFYSDHMLATLNYLTPAAQRLVTAVDVLRKVQQP